MVSRWTLLLGAFLFFESLAFAGRFKDVEVRGKALNFEEDTVTIEEEETGFVVYVSPKEVFVNEQEGGNAVLRDPAERQKRKGKAVKAYIPEKEFFPKDFFEKE